MPGGQGVLQDESEAVKWFQKAAAQGNPHAEYQLGTIYYAGEMAKKDYPTAFKWLSLAAAQGFKDSAQMLEKLKSDMTSAEITEGQRLLREFKPSKT
jgi:TPR repeat protein